MSRFQIFAPIVVLLIVGPVAYLAVKYEWDIANNLAPFILLLCLLPNVIILSFFYYKIIKIKK